MNKKELSVSIQDEVYKQGFEIVRKLNDCILDFNDFSNYNGRIVFELYKVRNDNYKRYNKLYFKKYQRYKSNKLLTLTHLNKNTLFDEFFYYDNIISKLERNVRNGDVESEQTLQYYLNTLDIFCEYIGYEMKIEEWYYYDEYGHKIYFKKIDK